jgi:hypothetical protein
MALSYSRIAGASVPNKFMGGRQCFAALITLDNAYVVGGWTLSAAGLGLTEIFALFPSNVGGFVFEWDDGNGKLKAFKNLAGPDMITAVMNGTWAVDGDGANTNGGGIVGGSVVLTEATAAYAVVEDYDAGGSDYQLLSTSATGAGFTANYQLLPDTEAIGDACYFGAAIPFCEVAFDMSATVQTYSDDAGKWQYWNGSAWTDLTIVKDQTDATAQDGKRPFGRDGALSFIPPTDWATTTVNSQSAYWIKWVVTAANVTQIGLTNSQEHEIVTPESPIIIPRDMTITGLRLSDSAATVHTTADIKFLLFNFTTGEYEGEFTWAQDDRQAYYEGLTLTASAGDELGVLITQEDGTNEASDVAMEMICSSGGECAANESGLNGLQVPVFIFGH